MQSRRYTQIQERNGQVPFAAGVVLVFLVAVFMGGNLKAVPVDEAGDPDFPLYESQAPGEVADTVILKSGKVYTNVKTFPRGGVHTIKFQNGRAISVPNAKIKIVRIKGVSWRTGTKKRRRIAAVAKKRKPRRTATQVAATTRPRVRPRPRPAPRSRKPIGRELQAMQSDNQEKAPPREKGWELGPVSKSILIPGWGQYSMGHKTRAGGILALSVPIVYYYFTYRNEHTAAQASYSDQVLPAILAQAQFSPIGTPLYYTIIEQRRSLLLRKETETNSMVFALMGLWGLQTLDAYYLNLRNGGEYPFFRPGRKLGFTPSSHSHTTLLAFSDGENFIIGVGVRF